MPRSHLPSAGVRRTLRKLGQDIREARLRRNLPMELVAARAFTSRATVTRVEKGDPSVSMGIYAQVLQALGLLPGVGDLADPGRDPVGQTLAAEALPKRARLARPRRPERTEDAGE